MKFVQIIEFEATDEELAQGNALIEEYRSQTEGKRSTGRAMMLRDRDNPGKYYNVVEFPSYEEAMKNNDLPETQAMAQKMQAMSSSQPKFVNCDLVQEMLD